MERLRGGTPDNNYNIVGNLLENLQKIRKSYPLRSIVEYNLSDFGFPCSTSIGCIASTILVFI